MLSDDLTLREKIIEVLKNTETPLTVDDIIALLGLRQSDRRLVYDAILHAAKSLSRKSHGRLEIVMVPPYCMKCGYLFKDLKKPRKPSKCPRCKSERIAPPRFIIREKI